jgi:hypothetical protein
MTVSEQNNQEGNFDSPGEEGEEGIIDDDFEDEDDDGTSEDGETEETGDDDDVSAGRCAGIQTGIFLLYSQQASSRSTG